MSTMTPTSNTMGPSTFTAITPSSATPATTTTTGVLTTITSKLNILAIGIITHHDSAELTTDTMKRDHSRVLSLRNEFKTVFTMSAESGFFDPCYHLAHKMNRNGAKKLNTKLDSNFPTLRFDCICLEYVRMPGAYYQKFVTGCVCTPAPGCSLRDFVTTLRGNNKLKCGCKVLIARMESSDRWLKTIQNLEKEFGNVRYVEPMDNPLFRAGERTRADNEENLKRPYDHRYELKQHCRDPKPFAEFTVGQFTSNDPASPPAVKSSQSNTGFHGHGWSKQPTTIPAHDVSTSKLLPNVPALPVSSTSTIVTPEMILKAAKEIHAGNGSYRHVCQKMGINCDAAGEYMDSTTREYKDVQYQIRKLQRYELKRAASAEKTKGDGSQCRMLQNSSCAPEKQKRNCGILGLDCCTTSKLPRTEGLKTTNGNDTSHLTYCY